MSISRRRRQALLRAQACHVRMHGHHACFQALGPANARTHTPHAPVGPDSAPPAVTSSFGWGGGTTPIPHLPATHGWWCMLGEGLCVPPGPLVSALSLAIDGFAAACKNRPPHHRFASSPAGARTVVLPAHSSSPPTHTHIPPAETGPAVPAGACSGCLVQQLLPCSNSEADTALHQAPTFRCMFCILHSFAYATCGSVTCWRASHLRSESVV